ncbi:MAG: hypothetical protein ABIP94_02800 [Planctomycetota bacterium]
MITTLLNARATPVKVDQSMALASVLSLPGGARLGGTAALKFHLN